MAANAAWMARALAGDSAPATVISTRVPSKGRARRDSAVLAASERDVIKGKQAFYPVGDVPAGKRRAADVLDVVVQFQLRRRVFPDKLLPPRIVADFVAIRFAIFHHLDAPHTAI